MRTRRDQVQAYRFVTRRIVSALLSGEPEAVERPMRRLGLSVFASTMVATLLVAAAGVWGLVTNQGRGLDNGIVVIEKETRAHYLYLEGRLHPVLNMASAQLILEQPNPTVRNGVSRATLRDIPRGRTLGIPDAPVALPPVNELLGLPWRVCSLPPTADSSEPTTVVIVGEEVPEGSELGDLGLYVSVDNTGYLLWEDRLLRIAHQVGPVALGLSAVSPTPIGTPLVNALTTGPDLDVVRPEGFDEPTDIEIQGNQAYVGHIYFTGGQHYVMTREGLRPLGDLTVALRTSIGAAQVRDITGFEVSRFLVSNDPLEPPGYPMQVPEIHPATGRSPTVCALYQGPSDAGTAVRVEVHTEPLPISGQTQPLRQTERDTVAAADLMWMKPGHGALVQAATLSGETTAESTVYLITDQGFKYPIGSEGALLALGYGQAEAPHPVPVDLLELIPTGPVLDFDLAQAGLDPPEEA